MSGVEIRVRSNSTQARQDLGKLQKSVGNIEQSTKRLQSAFNKIAIGGAAFLSLASFTKGITRASDSITNMENKIALVTGRGRELNSTFQSLARVSSQTRVSFSTTAETFNRFGLALRGSGTSAKELLDVTRTINQAVTISGASSESARAAIVQFGQGLASGQLRGQELNSVLEQTPRIARAIADGIGIPFGQLRDAAAEGKLTTEAVLKSIQKAAPEIAQEFTLIEKTVDSVSNALRFRLQEALSLIARETGWSNIVIGSIERVTNALKFFTDNAKISFLLYRAEARIFINSVKELFAPLTSIFSIDFNPATAQKNLQENFDAFLLKAKEIISFDKFYDETTNQFDFSKFFKEFILPESFESNFNKAGQVVLTFVKNIKGLFNELFGEEIKIKKVPEFGAKILPASFTSQEVESEIGLFDKFLNKITEFSGEAIARLLNLTETIAPLFKSISDTVASVISSIQATIKGFGSYEGILEGTTTGLKKYYAEIEKILGLNEKSKNAQSFIEGLVPEANTDLSGKIRDQIEKIESNLFGQEFFLEAGVKIKTPGSIEKSFDFLEDNKYLLAAAATGLGLAITFPETTGAALQLAAIGAGLAFVSVIQAGFSRGLPVLLAIGGFELFIKGTDSDQEYQDKIKNFFKDITIDVRNIIIGGDQKGASSLVNDLSAFLAAVGDGIIEGIFPGLDFEAKFADAFVGALAFAIPLAMVGFKPARYVISGLAGALFGNDLIDLGKKILLTSIKTIFKGLVLGEIFSFTLQSAGLGEKEAEAYGKTLSGAFVGGQTGALLGTGVAGPIGGLIGAIGGTLIGAIAGAFLSPEVRSAALSFIDYIGNLISTTFKSIKDFFTPAEKTDEQKKILAGKQITTLQERLDKAKEREAGFEESITRLKDRLNNDFVGDDANAQQRIDQIQTQIDLLKIPELEAELNQVTSEFSDFNTNLLIANKAFKETAESVTSFEGVLLDSLVAAQRRQNNLNNIASPHFGEKASGGMITGAGGPKDDKIPHMLSNGEYVVQASAVKKFGPSFMDALNKGQVPQFKSGGGLGGPQSAIFGGLSASSLSLIQFMSGEEAAKLKAIAGINFTGKDYFEKVMGDKDSDVLNYLNEHAPDLSPALNINVKDENSLKELIELVNKETGTNPSNINAIQEHLIRRGTLKSTKDAYNSPDGFYKGLSVLSKQLGIDFPEYDGLRTIPKALMTTANLASAAIGGGGRWKSDQYRPLVRGWEKGLYGPKGDDITGFGPELRKAFFNGLPLAPEGAAYGASFGALKGLSSTILGTFKGLGNIVLGTINRDPKKLLSGALGFGSSVVKTGLGLSSIPVQAALYGLLGGTMYTAMGGLDYLLSGNRTYMGNARDLNMFEKKATHDDRGHPMIAPSNYSTMRSGLDFTDFDSFKNKFSKIDLSFLNKEQKRQAAIDASGYDLNYLLRHYNLVRESFQRPSGREKVGLQSTSIDNTWQGKVIPKYYETLDSPFLDIQTKEPKLTDSLDEFLQAYNVGLHEYGHVNQFLNMAKENPGHGKTDHDYISSWPSRINRTVLEADANSFLKQTSLADIEDTLKTLRASQTSYMAGSMISGTLTPEAFKDSLEVTELKEFEEFYEAFLEGNKTIGGKSQAAIVKFLYNNFGLKDTMKKSFEANKFATGGYVTGEGGPTDDKIPAMLSNKEFVVNAKQTSKFRPILEAINSGMVAGFQQGTGNSRLNIPVGNMAAVEPKLKLSPLEQQLKGVQEEIDHWENKLKDAKKTTAKANGDIEVLNDSLGAQALINERLIPLQNEEIALKKEIEIAAKGANKAVDGVAKAIKGLTLSAREMALGATFAQGIKDDFQTGFREALQTGDFMQIDLIDSFTKNYLNSFSQGFTDSLFGTIEEDKGEYTSTGMMGQLQKLGGGAASFGGEASPMAKEGEELTSPLFGEGGLFGSIISSIKNGVQGLTADTGDGGGLLGMIGKIPDFFGGLGKSLKLGLDSLLKPQGGSGGSGGASGGGWLGLISTGLSLFMNNGGIVPSTPYSKAGVDSVPAMLTPGELVVPANKVKSYQDNTSKQQNVVNLSISGDVSRQTRQEIIKMLPTISAGVNATNKENNYKGR